MESKEGMRRSTDSGAREADGLKTATTSKVSHEGGNVNSNGASPDLLAFARNAVRLGYSILPTTNDGTKAPGRGRKPMPWGPYQRKRPTPPEITRWFPPTQHGVGVVAGKISGNVEFLDCDSHAVFALFCEIALYWGLGDLLSRVRAGYEDETPKGSHLAWKCEEIAKSMKLALRPATPEELAINPGDPTKTLIETKGEGGFIIIAPSYGNTHPDGKPYKQVSGGLATIATITKEEREALLDLARSLNEVVQPAREERRPRQPHTGQRPGDLFNADPGVTWASILLPHGWTAVYEQGEATHWRRPGKKDVGASATTNYAGSDYFYCFSTSTRFQAERGYDKFGVYTLLNHDGDFIKAAEDLLRQGYFPRGDASTDEAGETTTSAEEEAASTASGDTLHKIRITTRMTPVVNEAEKALLALPHGPHLFQRLNQLCLITHIATPPKWLTRPMGAPSIAACSPEQLREQMSAAADWEKLDVRAKQWKPALPPEWAVKTLHGRGKWGFPVLADVISAPTLREDGEIISAPGYDPDTGLFLDTQGVKFPPIPTQPTLDDAVRAVASLSEPFADFPFAGEQKKNAALSAALSPILSLVARLAINGCVPLFAVDSTTRGTGKGLLIDGCCTIATGRPAPRWAQTADAEEDKKALLTIGMEGDACVHIDNITHALGSGPLDLALTTRTMKGRLLGLNKSAEVPMNCVFFASGNNITYVGDMGRRVVPIHLESLLEKPENRDDFRQPRLLDWVRKERPRLVIAALTILRAYFVAGRPKQGISAYGSFEQWSDLVRSALIWAGCADPCEGRATIEAESDPGYENLARLLHCWEACYHSEAVTLSVVIGDVQQRSADIIANDWNELSEALAAFDSRYDGKRLDSKRIGNALRTVKGRVIGGQRLIQAGKSHQAILWVIQKV